MAGITCVIIDDERHGRENLAGILREHCPDVLVIGEADKVQSAISLITRLKPDLVFLDVEMPGENGFKVLEHFEEIDFEVIFVTAYDSYAIKAIRFSASDYILKPIHIFELQTAVEKVTKQIEQKQENLKMKQLLHNIHRPLNPRIGLPAGDSTIFVDAGEIIRCQGEGNYSHIYYAGNKHLLVARTLVEFEELLSEFGFLRIHKSHLVNLKQVKSYIRRKGGRVLLSNGETIPVSRRRNSDVLQALDMLKKDTM